MEGLPIIEYEKYKISWSEEEGIFYFHCYDVKEFKPDNYLLFKDNYTGIHTTFELIEDAEEGWLYNAIGNSGIKKPCKLLVIK